MIPVPAGVSERDAACAPIAFSTVQHMLFDNAKLQPGETVLVHAGGSGIGTVAIMMAKAIGCTVITTVGDDSKIDGVKALGADHVINYRKDRFEHETRKITKKKGVDVVFEHVGADTFNGSLLSLKRGGRLVTCGSTSGPTDDNASGVAAMLALARIVSAAPLRHAVVFVAFDAEELGLEGSKQFVKDEHLTPARVAIDVNLDMVSRNDRREIFATGTTPEPWLRPILDDVQRRSAVKILFGHDRSMTKGGLGDDWTQQSDQGAFVDAGIDYLYFGVEDHADYHKPSDTADKVDPAFSAMWPT